MNEASFNPFNPKGESYDQPLGRFRMRAYYYRVITLGLLVLALMLSGILIEVLRMPSVKMMGVQILSTGVATGVGQLPLQSSELGLKMIQQGEKNDG